MAPDRAEATAVHHAPVSDVVILLGTDAAAGLSEPEARHRLQRFGPNSLPPVKGPSALRRWFDQFNHPLIYVLLGAAAVTALLGETVDAAVIMGVVLINAVIGYVQESRADTALQALSAMTRTTARVVRSGATREVDAAELAPGDLVVLEAGDRVPADIRLSRVHEMTADESMLTGESVPVGKHALALARDTVLADRANMAYSGTLVIRGQASGIVVDTGSQTEIGRIQQLVGGASGVETPLTRKLGVFSRWLTWAILVLAVATFMVGIARGESVSYMVTAAVALAVGAIPEGLPAAVTITLAIGVGRMARRNAIIRHLPAVEALGSTTVVCTDKTGTLTRNRMTLVAVDVGGAHLDPTDGVPQANPMLDGPLAEDPRVACLAAATLCNNADIDTTGAEVTTAGDPTETALLIAAHEASLSAATLEELWPRLDEIPFDAERRFMATLHGAPAAFGPDAAVLLAKGAVERLAPRCSDALRSDGTSGAIDLRETLDRVEELASRALRVLAVVRGRARRHDAPGTVLEAGGMTLLGLACLIDPARPEAITSVQRCRDAGIAVKMITGDHPATGAAIGMDVGLAGQAVPRVVTGQHLASVSDEALPELIEDTHVFARVTAEQKLRIVLALQSRHEVVAMTGDGVNDAPALKQADIGVAMGLVGSEVAKDSADMILTDDNFATIEAAVEEGRGVFDNLTKFITWALPTSLGEGLVILAAIAASATLPITPVQILWVNMTTAVALGIMLAFEPGEAGIMDRPPRDPDQPILTGILMSRIVMVSAIMVVGAFSLFQYQLAAGSSVDVARTVAVNAFVLVEMAYLFNCRTLTRWAGSIGWFSNRLLLLGVAIQVALQLVFTYLPWMNSLFGSAPLRPTGWIPVIALAVAAFGVVEVEKAVRRAAGGPPTGSEPVRGPAIVGQN